MPFPLSSGTLVAEVNLDSACLELLEGVAELAATADGDDIAILALGDRKAERKRARRFVAVARAERCGGQNLALAVLHEELSVAADVGVATRSLTRCPVRLRSR